MICRVEIQHARPDDPVLGPYFAVDQVLDHSGDPLPTFRFWRDNINRQLSALRGVARDETVVLVRRQLDTTIGPTERERLSLYRVLLRARRPRVIEHTGERLR